MVVLSRIGLAALAIGSLCHGASRPEEWKAISYAPRGHPYFRMLYDWYSTDAPTGLAVRQMAGADLALLRASGFNAVHLYLWDQPTFAQFRRTGASKGLEPAGFTYPDPSVSPRRQWEALDEFVSMAEGNGIWVIPHLVHTPFNEGIDSLNRAQVERRAAEIAAWAGAFIDYLAPRHANILAWGALYALEPAPDDDPARPNNYSLLWRKVYAALKRKAGQTPLVTYLFLPSDGRDLSAPGARIAAGTLDGYTLNAAVAKQRWASMKRHLRAELGRAAEPDVVYAYLFGPDTAALEKSLTELTTGEGAVPAGRLFLAEFGISAPFGSHGKAVLSFGENGAPTTDLEGQAVWLRQCLCAMRAAGVRKAAYWTLYDAAGLWSSEVWGQSPGEVSLNGHWGLAFEDGARGFKPAWDVIREFHSDSAARCEAHRAAVLDGRGGPVRFAAKAGQATTEKAAIVAPRGITVNAVVSPASFKPTAWYPGALLTIYVSGLEELPSLWQSDSYPLPFEQFGIRVEFQAETGVWRQGALLAIVGGAGVQMINVQIPWELSYVTALRVYQDARVSTNAYSSAADCCAFFRDAQGNAIAFHEATGESVTADNPARTGEAVRLYLTGALWRPRRVPLTGEPIDPAAPADDYRVLPDLNAQSQFRITVNQTDGPAGRNITYVRLAPDSVGVFQVRLIVPAIDAVQRMNIYYGQCSNFYFKYGPGFPCVGGYMRRGEVNLEVAPGNE